MKPEFKVGDRVGIKCGSHGIISEHIIKELKLHTSIFMVNPDGTETPVADLHAFFENGDWFPLEHDYFTSRNWYELVKL
jgi:hypothetical protein